MDDADDERMDMAQLILGAGEQDMRGMRKRG